MLDRGLLAGYSAVACAVTLVVGSSKRSEALVPSLESGARLTVADRRQRLVAASLVCVLVK